RRVLRGTTPTTSFPSSTTSTSSSPGSIALGAVLLGPEVPAVDLGQRELERTERRDTLHRLGRIGVRVVVAPEDRGMQRPGPQIGQCLVPLAPMFRHLGAELGERNPDTVL